MRADAKAPTIWRCLRPVLQLEGRTSPSVEPCAPTLSLAIFQRQVPDYRIPIFERIARETSVDLTIYSTAFAAPVRGATCVRLSERKLSPFLLHPVLFSRTFRRSHDVLLCEGRLALAASVSLALAQRTLGLPVVWWTSFWRPDGTIGLGGGLRGPVLRRILRSCRAIATYSQAAAQVAIAAGLPAERVFIAYNSLDTDLLQRVEKEYRASNTSLNETFQRLGINARSIALFVGRLTKGKRLGTLIEAWARVCRGNVGAPLLVIVGEGPERVRLRALVERHGVSDKVLFTGEIRDYISVCPYFLGARVLVLPGAGGLAINHAMTHGVPVVVAGGDGTERDVVDDGVNGFLVPESDAEGLASRLHDVLTMDMARWREMSEQARSVVQTKANINCMVGALLSAVHLAAGRYPVGHLTASTESLAKGAAMASADTLGPA